MITNTDPDGIIGAWEVCSQKEMEKVIRGCLKGREQPLFY